MDIHSELRALRSDPAPQCDAQARLAAAKASWLVCDETQAITEQVELYGQGTELERLPQLGEVITSHERAQAWLSSLLGDLIAQLSGASLGQVPFRHQYSGQMALLQLIDTPQATLSLVLYEPGARTPAETACFGSGERHELCLAGQAFGRRLTLSERVGAAARIVAEDCTIKCGQSARFDNRHETKAIEHVGVGGLVLLRLSRTEANAVNSAEYRIADGELVHRAAGNRNDSRTELAMELLGAMGRTDAASAIADISRSGPDHVRWQAVRQSLTLSTERGFAALCAMAADPADTLAGPAGALRAQVLETYPALATLEKTRCPA